MRIQILSDIHAEFHVDSGIEFVQKYLTAKGIDILIVAGDLASGKSLLPVLRALTQHYEKTLILYVPGNHEFYGWSIPDFLTSLKRVEETLPNVRILYNDILVAKGIHFIGTTLWFPRDKKLTTYQNQLNDFRFIENYEKDVFSENKKAIDFLNWHVNKRAIVISHYLPSRKSLPSGYETSPLSMFFVCNMEKLIKERQPRAWVHGHTHTSANYLLGKTHVLCNPFGYAGYEINQEFITNMILEV